MNNQHIKYKFPFARIIIKSSLFQSLHKNREIGNLGENIIKNWLTEHEFEIIKHNYYGSQGEIDIIAQLQENLFFFEVKTRESHFLYGNGMDAINKKKIQKIYQTAEEFLQSFPWKGNVFVYLATVDYTQSEYCIDWIQIGL